MASLRAREKSKLTAKKVADLKKMLDNYTRTEEDLITLTDANKADLVNWLVNQAVAAEKRTEDALQKDHEKERLQILGRWQGDGNGDAAVAAAVDAAAADNLPMPEGYLRWSLAAPNWWIPQAVASDITSMLMKKQKNELMDILPLPLLRKRPNPGAKAGGSTRVYVQVTPGLNDDEENMKKMKLFFIGRVAATLDVTPKDAVTIGLLKGGGMTWCLSVTKSPGVAWHVGAKAKAEPEVITMEQVSETVNVPPSLLDAYGEDLKLEISKLTVPALVIRNGMLDDLKEKARRAAEKAAAAAAAKEQKEKGSGGKDSKEKEKTEKKSEKEDPWGPVMVELTRSQFAWEMSKPQAQQEQSSAGGSQAHDSPEAADSPETSTPQPTRASIRHLLR